MSVPSWHGITPIRGDGAGRPASQQFHVVNLLLHVTIVASQHPVGLVNDMEYSLHRLVVGDAFRVLAFHNAAKFIGDFNGLLLHHLIVLYDVKYHVGGNDRQS